MIMTKDVETSKGVQTKVCMCQLLPPIDSIDCVVTEIGAETLSSSLRICMTSMNCSMRSLTSGYLYVIVHSKIKTFFQ